MMLKCFIIDDEIDARNGLKEYIADTSFLEFCGESHDPLQAVESLNLLKPDILFLDIQMKNISGMDFLKLYKPAMSVILTTAYSNYAIESYELQVHDYLLKPVTYQRFLKAVESVAEKIRQKTAVHMDDHIFVKADGKIRKVMVQDILYIQSLQNYVTFNLVTGKLVTLITLKALEERLLEFGFIKIQKKYIINPRWVTAIEGGEVVVKDQYLPMSRNLKALVYQKLLQGKYLR